MFSGLIREIAQVREFSGSILRLQTRHQAQIGDSIAVNGACLSVIEVFENGLSLELSAHTREILALERLKGRVHLEPALRADSRLDGHFVQGHIDALGKITEIKKSHNQTHFHIHTSMQALQLCVPKGSICVDGVSLTIANVHPSTQSFELILIPLSMKDTLFGEYQAGMRVHLETDIIVRSIAHLLSAQGLLAPMQDAKSWEYFHSLAMAY